MLFQRPKTFLHSPSFTIFKHGKDASPPCSYCISTDTLFSLFEYFYIHFYLKQTDITPTMSFLTHTWFPTIKHLRKHLIGFPLQLVCDYWGKTFLPWSLKQFTSSRFIYYFSLGFREYSVKHCHNKPNGNVLVYCECTNVDMYSYECVAFICWQVVWVIWNPAAHIAYRK